MIHVPISEEALNAYVVETLIEDLNRARQSVVRLKFRLAHNFRLESYEEQDLDYDTFLVEALQNVLTYYIPHNDYEEKVGVPHPQPLD